MKNLHRMMMKREKTYLFKMGKYIKPGIRLDVFTHLEEAKSKTCKKHK